MHLVIFFNLGGLHSAVALRACLYHFPQTKNIWYPVVSPDLFSSVTWFRAWRHKPVEHGFQTVFSFKRICPALCNSENKVSDGEEMKRGHWQAGGCHTDRSFWGRYPEDNGSPCGHASESPGTFRTGAANHAWSSVQWLRWWGFVVPIIRQETGDLHDLPLGKYVRETGGVLGI